MILHCCKNRSSAVKLCNFYHPMLQATALCTIFHSSRYAAIQSDSCTVKGEVQYCTLQLQYISVQYTVQYNNDVVTAVLPCELKKSCKVTNSPSAFHHMRFLLFRQKKEISDRSVKSFWAMENRKSATMYT